LFSDQKRTGLYGSASANNPAKPLFVMEHIIICENVNNKCQKTRYLVGRMAKPLVGTRKMIGDRMYDKIIMSQIK